MFWKIKWVRQTKKFGQLWPYDIYFIVGTSCDIPANVKMKWNETLLKSLQNKNMFEN